MHLLKYDMQALFMRGAARRRTFGPRRRNCRSIALGAVLFLTASLVLATSMACASEKYGGVEIGAKGVKASAVEVGADGSQPTLKILELRKETENVTISRLKGKNFADVLIDDVADVIQGFIKDLQVELGVPESNIQVVASSGVPFANNFADLVTAVRKRTGKDIDKLDATQEATLTALALVPKDLRTQVLLVDVGSGNTKGGTFLDGTATPEKFATLDAPFGTTSLSRAIDKKAETETGVSRADIARELSRQLVGDPLRKRLAQEPELGRRNKVLFAGGSVWAFVTIMKPETASNPFPEVTAGDIKAYVELINRTPGKYPEVDFARVADAGARKAAEADYGRIRGTSGGAPVFNPHELQAGAALLEQIGDALDFSKRRIYFDRKAVTAWITARITPEEYRPLLPQALKRKFPFSSAPEPTPEPRPVQVSGRANEEVAGNAYGAGYELYWSGHQNEALSAFKNALNYSNGDARYWYYKGLSELALGDDQAAHASFSQGVRLELRNMPDSQTVGVALVRLQGPVRRHLEELKGRIKAAVLTSGGRE